MSTELVTIHPEHSRAILPSVDSGDIVGAFLAGRKATTLKAYSFDLADFAKYLGAASSGAAVDLLLSGSAGQANTAVLGYKHNLQARGLATATIGRRLAALRSIVKLARTLGRVTWAIDIEAPRVQARRDVRGPDQEGWKTLWGTAKAVGDTPKALRDRALLALLHDLGSRRAGVTALDVADVNLEESTIAIVGKGDIEPRRHTLPKPTRRAIEEWLAVRGIEPGPLFVRLDPAGKRQRMTGDGLPELPGDLAELAIGKRQRMTGDGLCKVVKTLGTKAGLARQVRPHGLRHCAITSALDLGRDVRDVRKFSGHVKLDTVLKYDDARHDTAGEIASELAADRE
jgi:integrase/recombinase XerC